MSGGKDNDSTFFQKKDTQVLFWTKAPTLQCEILSPKEGKASRLKFTSSWWRSTFATFLDNSDFFRESIRNNEAASSRIIAEFMIPGSDQDFISDQNSPDNCSPQNASDCFWWASCFRQSLVISSALIFENNCVHSNETVKTRCYLLCRRLNTFFTLLFIWNTLNNESIHICLAHCETKLLKI